MQLSRIILYVRDVTMLKEFYTCHFSLKVIEEIQKEWLVLQAGNMELALHKVGKQYETMHRDPGSGNSKIVFTATQDLHALRASLVAAGVTMREIKKYDGFQYLLCDGEDPEGNVFQIMQTL